MNDDRLVLTSEKVSKLNKRILEQLKELDSIEKPKLSKIQEITSKSLGFRDFHELQSRINPSEKQNNPTEVKESLLDRINEDGLSLLIFENLTVNYTLDTWAKRSKILLCTVVEILRQKQKNGILKSITTSEIKEHIKIEVLIEVAKKTDDSALKNTLLGYLSDQLGVDITNDTISRNAREQHSYLESQVLGLLKELEKVEKNDFYVFKSEWMNGFNVLIRPNLKKEITDLDFFEDSWLDVLEFKDYLASLHLKGKLKDMRMSDLLFNSTKIIAPERRNMLCKTIRSIVTNYELASEMSKSMCDAVA